MSRLVCGIDPGKRGGLAVLNENKVVMDLIVMPDTTRELAEFLSKWRKESEEGQLMVFCERAQSMPLNGVVATFNYACHYGQILGVMVTLDIAHELVPPMVWAKEMHTGLPHRQNPKEKSLTAAQRLFPSQTFLSSARCIKPHDGLYEAILIAEYGRRRLSRS